MLIEQSAYSNRWRGVSPSAKGLFALFGLIAAFVASTPLAAGVVAGLLAVAALLGARVLPSRLVRVAAPAFGFLLIGSVSLLVSPGFDAQGSLMVHWLPEGSGPFFKLVSRSAAALAALLFLVLTTPLIDLIALLRWLKMPEVLLELMIICYRMLFVFSEALHDTLTAQSARLGYATPRLALRSLGQLTAGLTLQIWSRAHDLHVAAQARNNDGPLRFLEPVFANTGRDLAIAAMGGAGLIFVAVMA